MHLSVNFPLFISSCLTYVQFLVTELKHLRREVEELKGLMCRNNGKAFQVETCSFKVSALSLHMYMHEYIYMYCINEMYLNQYDIVNIKKNSMY